MPDLIDPLPRGSTAATDFPVAAAISGVDKFVLRDARCNRHAIAERSLCDSRRIAACRKPSALARHALPAGNLAFAGAIERRVGNPLARSAWIARTISA